MGERIKKIHFHSQEVRIHLRNRTLLKRFLLLLFKKEGQNLVQLRYIFCTDNYLLRINRQFLNHDDFTDIITFNLSVDTKRTDGEIYISLERVRENALIFQEPVQNEILRVIFHGALHLCGYSDKTKRQKLQMRQKEDHYLLGYAKYVSRETGST